MELNRGERAKIEMGAVEEAQIESLFEKLKTSNTSPKIVKENVEKCELQFEEAGADIDEIFTKVYGEPGQPISAEKQKEIINKENARRKRAERMSSSENKDEKIVEESGNTTSEMGLVDEDVIKRDTVNIEEAEIDWDKVDKVLEKLCSPENVETAANWFGGFFSCSVV